MYTKKFRGTLLKIQMPSRVRDRSVVSTAMPPGKKRKPSSSVSPQSGRHEEEEELSVEQSAGGLVETTGDVFSGSVFTSLSEDHLNGCRTTPTGEYDVIGVVAKVCGCDRDTAKKKINEIKKGNSGPEFPHTILFQFPGERQRPTSVAPAQNILRIITLLPKKFSQRFRDEQAELQARAISGDVTIAKAILDRADVLNNTRTLTTSTAAPTDMDTRAHSRIHNLLAKVHVDTPQHKEEDRRMMFSEITQDTATGMHIINSEFVAASELLDQIWDSMGNPTVTGADKRESLYAVRLADSDAVKIGRSGNVLRRLSNLQVGCPMDLHIEFTVLVHDAAKWEKIIHAHLTVNGKHIRGEWFTMPKPLDMFGLLKECGL